VQDVVVKSIAQHQLLHSAAGVVHPHRIQGYPIAADEDPGLSGGQKAGAQAALQAGPVQFQAGGHFAHGHIGAHRQYPPTGERAS
jgi:hypothetical protein